MRTNTTPNLHRAIFLGMIVFPLPIAAGAQKEARFPNVTGQNLEQKRLHLPNDLQGDLNIVFLGFRQEQQSVIDTWLPAVCALSATNPALRYYEIPVFQKTTQEAEDLIDTGTYPWLPDAERKRAIVLKLDKKPFERSLDISGEENVPVLLLDRQGKIVWRGEGNSTPEKEKRLASAAQEWLTTQGPRIETLAGKNASLTDFHGKTVLLILSGKGPAHAAGLLLQEVLIGSHAQSDIVYVTDADLTAAPSVLRGMVRTDVKSTAKKNNERLVAALAQAGVPYTPEIEPVTLLDWQGVLSRQFDVSGRTEHAYQVFVLDREGRTVFHYEPSPADEKAASPAPQILRILQETALKKTNAP